MPSLTVTASAPQSARVVHAVGISMGLGRDATVAEVQQFIRLYLDSVCKQIERNEFNAGLVQTDLGLT